MSSASTVVVTGASGLLGRAVMARLKDSGAWKQIVGTAFSRSGGGLVRLDLTDPSAVAAFIRETKPALLVHSAAQRFPDKVEGDTEAARRLNVASTEAIAKAMVEHGGRVLYISTDYVFDGMQPPYVVSARPNPLSEYGTQKLMGEHAVLESVAFAVLRVPLLYGPVEYLKESAVTALYSDLQQSLGKADHGQKRYPTYTCDVARIISKMLDAHRAGKLLRGIFHWQADECLTKYDMVQAIAEVMDVNASKVVADLSLPKFPRPEDTRLDCSRLVVELDIDPVQFRTPFREALVASLRPLAAEPEGTSSTSTSSCSSSLHTLAHDAAKIEFLSDCHTARAKRKCVDAKEACHSPVWSSIYKQSVLTCAGDVQ